MWRLCLDNYIKFLLQHVNTDVVFLGQFGLLVSMVVMALTHFNPIPPVLIVGLVFSLVPGTQPNPTQPDPTQPQP